MSTLTEPLREERRPRWDRRLSPLEKTALALEILGAYVRIRYVLVRYRELPEALAVLRREPDAAKPYVGLSTLEAGYRLGIAVVRTLRLLPTDSRCLMRSLVLISLLARRGIPARLVIGVKPGSEDEFAAHAWVEHDERPLLPPGRDYGRLTEL